MDRTKTDTMIAITGAVALVFTVVGVFAYEYNTVHEDDSMDEVVNLLTEQYNGTLSSDSFFEDTFTPGPGVTGMDVRIDWSPTASAVLAPLAACEYELLLSDGSILDSGDCTTGAAFAVPQPTASPYTIRIIVPATGAGGDFVVAATYDY